MDSELRYLSVPNNLPTPVEEESSKRISLLRKTLNKAQNRSGSYGGIGLLEEIVVTSQAILALSALGDHRDVKRVDKALKWLSTQKVINSEYSYWALAPFNCADGYINEVNTLFQKADSLAFNKLKHHENSPLSNFVFEHAHMLKKETDFTNAERSELKKILSKEDVLRGFAGQVLSHTLLIATLAGVAKEIHYETANKILEEKSDQNSNSMKWPGNIASTCYVLINLINLKSICGTLAFDNTIEKAYNAIIYALDHSEISTTLPAGGNFLKPIIYTKALILRALIRYWSWKKDWRRIGITKHDVSKFRSKLLVASIAFFSIITLFAWYAETLLSILLPYSVQNETGVPDYWETLDRVANILGILGGPGLVILLILAGRYLYNFMKN